MRDDPLPSPHSPHSPHTRAREDLCLARAGLAVVPPSPSLVSVSVWQISYCLFAGHHCLPGWLAGAGCYLDSPICDFAIQTAPVTICTQVGATTFISPPDQTTRYFPTRKLNIFQELRTVTKTRDSNCKTFSGTFHIFFLTQSLL